VVDDATDTGFAARSPDHAAPLAVPAAALPAWLTDGRVPLGPDAAPVRGWQLRAWGLSEVWRLELAGGRGPRTVIVKRGTGEMAYEAEIYRTLVVPLGLPAPRLLGAAGGHRDGAGAVVLALADAGSRTLEQRPSADGYRQAVRTLARMRARAARRLARGPLPPALQVRTAAHFATAARIAAAGVARLRPPLAGGLDGPVRWLVEHLDDTAPATVVHGDFHAKNLVLAADGAITVVDWPTAALGTHLGDLYCLMRDARKAGVAEEVGAVALPGVFAEEAGCPRARVEAELTVGGLCWTVQALRWVVEEGVGVVDDWPQWLDELVADARALAGGAYACG
jgi:hypothetical protein